MTDIATLKQIPFDDLWKYYQSLHAICERLEFEKQPLFGSTNPTDVQKWKLIETKLSVTRNYYNLVFEALREKVIIEIDNISLPRPTGEMTNIAKENEKLPPKSKRSPKKRNSGT